MSYRSLAFALAGATLLSLHVGSAAAQSVYVGPGGIYIGAGAGPVYVTPLCQTGTTTVDHDRPMRLRCRHDRAWPCPIGVLAAVPGTVIDLKLSVWLRGPGFDFDPGVRV
jgi:hypothetical protein